MVNRVNWLILVAGGSGKRVNLGFNKVFAKIGKFTVLEQTLIPFEKSKAVDKIIISIGKADLKKAKGLVRKRAFKKIVDFVPAGESRQDSTLQILEAYKLPRPERPRYSPRSLHERADTPTLGSMYSLSRIHPRTKSPRWSASEYKNKMDNYDLVGVHNGVNPFVSQEEIREVYKSAGAFGAAILAQKAKDTVKIADENGLVSLTPLREFSWYAQTPQVATFENLLKAHMKAKKDNFVGTDDAQLLERVGIRPKIVACSNRNFKITFIEDLASAKNILKTWTD